MNIIDINTLVGGYPTGRATETPTDLAEALLKANVSKAFTLSTWGVYYQDIAGNEETLQIAREAPQQIIPAGTINPLTFWDSGDTIKLMIQSSFQVVRFFPGEQGWPVDFLPFERILKTLSELAVPIFVSISKPGDITQLTRIAGGYPAPVVLTGVNTQTLIEALAALTQFDKFAIETHRLIGPDSLERVRDAVGAQRILFGSGGPALSIRAAIKHIQSAEFNDNEQAAVLGGNAEALLLQGGH
jgi:predicted TIM-barrel fold metal-dependent hydrolase